jgi:hypothetical protein
MFYEIWDEGSDLSMVEILTGIDRMSREDLFLGVFGAVMSRFFAQDGGALIDLVCRAKCQGAGTHFIQDGELFGNGSGSEAAAIGSLAFEYGGEVKGHCG